MNQLIQKAVSEVEKLKRELTPDAEVAGNPAKWPISVHSYNQGVQDASVLLPQIITGVIEEIEKRVEERYPESFATREVGDHREFMRGKRFPEYVTILLGEEKEAVEWFLSILKEVVKE